MAEKKRTPKQSELTVPVRLRWEIPDDMDVLWASNFSIQHTGREFLLTFFQAVPPLLIEPTEEELKAIAVEGIRAKAVARIALTPAALQELIDVVQVNWASFVKLSEQREEKE